MNYKAANTAWRRFRSALTRARKRMDHAAVIRVVDEAEWHFRACDWPLPDDWALFDNAKRDALRAIEWERVSA